MRKFSVIIIICPLLILVGAGTARAAVYDVTDYGATGNGSTLDSPGINAAIAAADGAGGGTVYFPPGTYKSGSIVMKDNITLDLHANATIQATMANEYTAWDSFSCSGYDDDWGHSHWKCSLIWGVGVNNIGITGSGFINGTDPSTGGTGLDKGPPASGFADRALSFKNCTGIDIDGIKILRGGHFAIIATGCTDVNLSNLFIDTNRDGINIDCCNDVTITDCIVNSPCDDAICMKSSYALCEKRPTENVTISGCTVSGYAVGSVMSGSPTPDTACYSCGSIKFGTESYGGFKNITITDCTFDHSRGLTLATVDGADIENIYVDNLQMVAINDTPIFLRLGNRGRGPGPQPPGIYRNVNISNVTCDSTTSKLSCIASGIPGYYIEDISLSNLDITYAGGGTASDATIVLPENEAGYPYGGMFGGVTPCYGFYARHVDGITFGNCVFNVSSPDARPEFKFIDALNVSFGGFSSLVSSIDSPTDGSSVYYGDNVAFNGSASSGTPPYTTYTWQSNVDGFLGSGPSLNISNLSVATSGGTVVPHTITLTVVDSNSDSDTDQIDLTVKFHADFEPDGDVDFEDYVVFAKDWLAETTTMTLPSDPVAWWKFEEDGGSSAYDSSVNSNTGTLYNMNSSDWVTGYDGIALDFDGSNDYIRVPDSASISVGASDYTLCAWIYPHAISGRVGVITKPEGTFNKEYAFYVDSNRKLALEVERTGNNGFASTNDAVVQTGEWQHVMVVFNASTTTPVFYYNFVEAPRAPGSTILALPTVFDNDLYIGKWGEGYLNAWFDGVIDDVRIYNYQLQLSLQSSADFNEDDIVDFNDLGVLVNDWLVGLP